MQGYITETGIFEYLQKEELTHGIMDIICIGIIEKIIPETDIGKQPFYDRLHRSLADELQILEKDPDLIQKRYDRFRRLGVTR